MEEYPDVFGTTFNLDRRESYCVVGEFVHRDGLVDRNTGKIHPQQFNRITKSMYWFYLYSLWVDNESIPPMDQVTDRQSFPNDMNKMLCKFFKRRYKTSQMDEETVSKFIELDKKMMRLVYREHLLAFVNHVVDKLNKNPKSVLKLRLPSWQNATPSRLLVHQNRAYIARELQTNSIDTEIAQKDTKVDELIDSLLERANEKKQPMIKIEKEVITDGPVTDESKPVVVKVQATLKNRKKEVINY